MPLEWNQLPTKGVQVIITLGSHKGGCSKSTLTVNVAAELARQGRRVLVVDSDPNSSASRWIAYREQHSPERPPVTGIQKRGDLKNTLVDLDRGYDIVLVDTGGFDSQELRSAAIASHLLITPVRPSSMDTDTLPHFAEVITAVRDYNPGLVVRALFTQVPTNDRGRALDDGKGVLADYPEFPLFDTVMRMRSAYSTVNPLGRGVVEWNDYKAKAEIQVLVQEVIDLV
jgi:chromosome partitioning protein